MESQLYKDTLEDHIKNKKTFYLTLQSSLIPFIFDQLLRYFFFFLLINKLLGLGFFYLIQIVIIPILTYVFISKINKRVKLKLIRRITNQSFFAYPNTIGGVIIAIALIISLPIVNEVLIQSNLDSALARVILIIFIFVLVLFYYLVILINSYSTKITEVKFYANQNIAFDLDLKEFDKYNDSNLVKSVPSKAILETDHVEDFETDHVDENDVRIVKIDSDLKNMVNKSETYILESIFLGALSFSGFLTIISSDKMQDNLEVFRTVFYEIQEIFKSLVLLNLDNSLVLFNEFIISWSLFAFVAIQCLICSTFFLIVLATRIKFSNLTEKLDYLIRMASLFNSKEEEIYLLQVQQVKKLEKRLDYLNKKIEIIIKDSTEVLSKIRPIFYFMKWFRSFGIYMFYIILITSGLYFSSLAALVILGLIILGYLVRSLFSILSKSRIEKIITKYKTNRKL